MFCCAGVSRVAAVFLSGPFEPGEEPRPEELPKPPVKVMDYSSSSEESGSSDEEDEEGDNDRQDENLSSSDGSRSGPNQSKDGDTDSINTMVVHEGEDSPEAETTGSSYDDGTMIVQRTPEEKRGLHHPESNGFASHVNLPDLVRQNHSPTDHKGSNSQLDNGSEFQSRGLVKSPGKSSFTTFVDLGMYQMGASGETLQISGLSLNDVSRLSQLKYDDRKGSVVNVNPTNTRPHSDTPEIRKYKKRFNSEILCAALWGKRQRGSLSLARSPARSRSKVLDGIHRKVSFVGETLEHTAHKQAVRPNRSMPVFMLHGSLLLPFINLAFKQNLLFLSPSCTSPASP
uniref:Misshapen-like kinase 1 n=1 Tax=Callorhinchus milii TaxID=7868 RepID=A0A4W3GJA7_CALMI